MYHRVANLTPKEAQSPLMRDLTVSPKDFEEQVKYLADNHFTFLFARDVEAAEREGKPLPERAVAITLDDGYKEDRKRPSPSSESSARKQPSFSCPTPLIPADI